MFSFPRKGDQMTKPCSFFKSIGTAATILFLIAVSLNTCQCFAEQDVWLIDTHQAPWTHASEAGFEKVVYYQLVDNRWVRSDAESFFETQNPEVPLVVFFPGYTSTTSTTIEVGMSLVRMYKSEQKCRTVFWNWPSEKIRLRLAPDIRDKISIAEASGDYLAMFLNRLNPESQVCMLGFSFGNRIICDAVANLGDNRPDRMQIHLVLTAAATDWHWLMTGARHGDIPRLAEKILILYNPADRALKFYPFLYGDGSCPEALGRFGPPLSGIAPEYRNRIEAVNVQHYIGGRHLTIWHLQTPIFRQRMNDYLFFKGFDEEGVRE
jgi:hypothetical protein